MGDWEEFIASFWSALRSQQGSKPTAGKGSSLRAQIIKSGTAGILGGGEMSFGIVRQSRQIVDTSVGPAKRHLEIELPKRVSYQTGRHMIAVSSSDLLTYVAKVITLSYSRITHARLSSVSSIASISIPMT